MKPATHHLITALLPIASLWVGCNLSVDPSLTRPDQDASTDLDPSNEDSGSTLEADANPGPYDDAGLGDDASTLPCLGIVGCDVGSCPIDCGPDVGPTPPACSDDDDCDGDSVCRQSQCAARCTEELGCAGPRIDRRGPAMASDGERLFWTTLSDVDTSGNRLHNGAIWQLDDGGEPIVVATGFDFPTLWFVADGFLYFADDDWSDVAMQRVRVSGGNQTPESLLEGGNQVQAAWLTPEHVWWTVMVRDANGSVPDTVTVARVPRSSSGPAEVFSTSPRQVRGGNSSQLLYEEPLTPNGNLQALMVAGFDGSNPKQLDVAWSGWPLVDVGEDDVLLNRYDGLLDRVRLDGSPTLHLVSGSADLDRVVTKRLGEWLHWGYATIKGEALHVAFGRAHRELTWPFEDLGRYDVTWNKQDPIPAFALLGRGERLAYFHEGEGRLYTKNVPAYRCSPRAPCPPGLVCSALGSCE